MARLKQLSFRVLRKRLRATPSIYRLFAGYSLANPNTFQWSLVAIRQMHLRETSHKNVENAHSERKYLRYSGQSVRCNIQDEANLRYIHENMKSHRYLQSTSDVFFSFHYLICILQLVQLDILTTLTFIAFERVELFHNSVSSQDLRFRYEDSEKSRSSDLVLLRTVYQPKMIMTTSGQCRFFSFFVQSDRFLVCWSERQNFWSDPGGLDYQRRRVWSEDKANAEQNQSEKRTCWRNRIVFLGAGHIYDSIDTFIWTLTVDRPRHSAAYLRFLENLRDARPQRGSRRASHEKTVGHEL